MSWDLVMSLRSRAGGFHLPEIISIRLAVRDHREAALALARDLVKELDRTSEAPDPQLRLFDVPNVTNQEPNG